MLDEIIEVYRKYRANILEEFKNPKHMQVVIRIKPEAFLKLRTEEVRFYNNDEFYYIELLGRKTPIIIENDLPNNVEFIMQSQREYEREEEHKLFAKFYRMFETF